MVNFSIDKYKRYLDTYYNAEWLRHNGHEIQPYLRQLTHLYNTGEWIEQSELASTFADVYAYLQFAETVVDRPAQRVAQ
jgi:hypothetical protein